MIALWDPKLYLDFGAQRTRPARDLAQRLADLMGDASGARVLDLGCGPGNSTAALRAAFPSARLSGLDSSQEMIQAARSSGLDADWILADGRTWEAPEPFDAVFSNAVLQWMGDQGAVLGRLLSWLRPGGALAVQVPGNGESPLHRALRDTAADPAWMGRSATGFAGLDDSLRYHEPGFYAETLAAAGAAAIDVWETTYWHVLASRTDLIRWYSGTGMRPWLEALGNGADRDTQSALREGFKAAVLERAAPAYPEREDGSVLFPFRRIFFTAARPK